MENKEIIAMWKSGRSKETIIDTMIRQEKQHGEKIGKSECRKIIDQVIYNEVLRQLKED